MPKRIQYQMTLLLLIHFTISFKEITSEESTTNAGLHGDLANMPKFVDKELTVNVSVQKGSTAHLHCRVSGLRDQSVSWYRRRGEEIHLITVGFQTYHNDERFSLTFGHPNDWKLRIKYVQDHDEGTYECQVSSHPPLIRTIHLHVVVPAINILDDREVKLTEKFYKTGSTIQLQCQVADVPTTTSLQLSWYHGKNRINYDASRGGVSVKTELRGSIARSWLRVGDAKIEDSGTYFCNVSELSSTGVKIHIVPEKFPAAIQGAFSSNYIYHSEIILLVFVTTSSIFFTLFPMTGYALR